MNRNQYLVNIINLFHDLNEQGIRYCHWKSNCNLGRSMRGLTDLDLLVDRQHGERFRLILHQHDIKLVVSPPDKQYPAVEDYLGFDSGTGQLFHLHVHYQLILGEQLVKNYRLPLERALLDSAQTYSRNEIVKIPHPALELVVLTNRALLKYRDRDVVKDILSIRSPGLPASILREFEYLRAQTNLESVSNILKSHVDFLSPDIVIQCLTTIAESPRSGYVLYQLRRQLRCELAPYQRHSRWWAIRKYFSILLRQNLSVRHADPAKKTFASGGLTITIIGADGAGKSTVVNELSQWLSWKLNVHNYYMGSQQPSPTSRLLHVAFRITNKVYRIWSTSIGEKHTSSKALYWLQRLFHNFHHISIAQDRYRRYITGRRQAAQGAIVVYDRYPLLAIHRLMKEMPMDGPRIVVEVGNEMDGITRTLHRVERNIYRKIHPPDHIIVLHVSPDVSQQRKPDHNREMIETKSQVLRQMDPQGLCVTEIDADQSFEQALLQVKTVLWDLL